MRKLAILTVLFFGIGTAQAQAHWYFTPSRIEKNVKKPEGKIWAYKVNVAHAQGAIDFARHNRNFYSYKLWASVLKGHRWEISYGLRRIEQLRWETKPPHYYQWLCIHGYEGSWRDINDPYWGGLQMDRSFMRSYAPWWLLSRGWANTWTPLQQMWVAENAYSSGRGFGPWPNTARYCGLL